jgi:hypothetical protein
VAAHGALPPLAQGVVICGVVRGEIGALIFAREAMSAVDDCGALVGAALAGALRARLVGLARGVGSWVWRWARPGPPPASRALAPRRAALGRGRDHDLGQSQPRSGATPPRRACAAAVRRLRSGGCARLARAREG